MSDLQKTANIYWRMLNKQPVLHQEYIFCLKIVFGDHPGSPFHSLKKNLPEDITQALTQQQNKFHEITTQWRVIFTGRATIPDDQAVQFIVAIFNALEEVDHVFMKRVAPGITRSTRGSPDDHITRRPNVKLGWTLQLTTQGNGVYNCVREEIITSPGDLILLSPDALYDYKRDASCETWEHQWVYFILEDEWLDLLHWPEIGPNIYRTTASEEKLEKLKAIFNELNASHVDDSEFSQALTRNLLEQLLIRCSQLTPRTNTTPLDRRIIQAKNYITRNFNKSFSVKELADEIGLSSARLSTLFKQQTGMTIVHWRDEHRMTRASQLLSQTNLPISHLAEAVGYSDALYFSRCFHQQCGCSPSEYRANKQA